MRWAETVSGPAKVFSSNQSKVGLVVGFVLAATVVQLHHQGRSWWCSCRGFFWTSNAWGATTSQTFLDPYSFTHILHGLIFCGLLTLLARRLPGSWRLCLAIAIEAVWELIENTNTVIQHYRAATAALGYTGDTVMNSLGDIMCCGLGFVIARKLGWRRSLVLFMATEAVLLIWIRDSLLLEIIMLVNPINAIKVWQVVH
jgi:hypothetical protein